MAVTVAGPPDNSPNAPVRRPKPVQKNEIFKRIQADKGAGAESEEAAVATKPTTKKKTAVKKKIGRAVEGSKKPSKAPVSAPKSEEQAVVGVEAPPDPPAPLVERILAEFSTPEFGTIEAPVDLAERGSGEGTGDRLLILGYELGGDIPYRYIPPADPTGQRPMRLILAKGHPEQAVFEKVCRLPWSIKSETLGFELFFYSILDDVVQKVEQ
jgi:hypothetical protein